MGKNKIRPLHLVNDVTEETPIRQYLDLDYLFQMLETKQYYVSRKDTFSDSYEGVFPLNRVFPLSAVGENVPCQPKQDTNKCLRVWENIQKNKMVPTSCWTYNIEDRMVMWHSYTPKFGACINSTVHNVIASIKQNDYDIWCGKMTYHGYSAQNGFMMNLFSKIPAYKEEEECRFYFFEYEQPKNILSYINIDIDPSVMIDEIILSPLINKATAKKLAHFIRSKYGIKTTESNIKLKL